MSISMQDLNNKVAVVTGGASGIGLSIAKALAAEGCHLVIADRDTAGVEKAAEEVSAVGVRAVAAACDVTNNADIESLCDRAWSEFGRVDILVNNAGVTPDPTPFVETDENTLRWVFEVNLFGSWKVCQAFTKRFLEQGTPAHIVNTGSENSIASPTPMTAAYNSTKHALLGYSGILRMELPDFIGISVLCPGVVSTNLMQSIHHRPTEFGGPGTSIFDGQVMPGMPAEEIGTRTVEGIKKGDFFIVTHACVRYMVEERYNELLAAFDEQAPYYEGCEAYDTRAMMRAIAAQQGESS